MLGLGRRGGGERTSTEVLLPEVRPLTLLYYISFLTERAPLLYTAIDTWYAFRIPKTGSLLVICNVQ